MGISTLLQNMFLSWVHFVEFLPVLGIFSLGCFFLSKTDGKKAI